jgi:glycosyltransferase involved in cell wall biosynthesis
MINPSVSVVIPTRERCETLISSIRTCIEQNYDNLEIIISDNASHDDTEGVVRSFTDPRLRYIKTERRLSMTGNFEFALNQARPGFVCFIGDDDGLMPGAAAKVAEVVRQTGADAISGHAVRYAWPNHLIEGARNRLFIHKSDSKIEAGNPQADLASLVTFRPDILVCYRKLPGIYHGFVSSVVIEKAKRDGRYFHSITPDVYATLANSLVVRKFLRLHQPLTLEGSSARSNGASASTGIDQTEESRFLAENDLAFSDALVYAPSMSIVIAEAYLQVRSRFSEACKNHDFNMARVCGAALREACGPNRDQIFEAVTGIKKKHNVTPLESGVLFFSIQAAARRLFEAYTGGEIDCKIFGVRDVYHASLLAHYLLTLRHEGGGSWGISRVLSKLRKKLA